MKDYLSTLTLEPLVEANSVLDQELVLTAPSEEVILAGTDPRLKLLSHSSRTNLHKCPRKYQLYRLNSKELSLEEEAQAKQNVTFAYGTAVGVGIQSTLEGKSEEQVAIDTFLAWDTDLLSDNTKQKKSFWGAMFAVIQFRQICEQNGYLKDWELVTYNGAPAVELSFRIQLPDGFAYRGYVDAVLRNTKTGEVIVLECKTTVTANPNSANFKNSGQAIGYSIVLDILFPDLSSYDVAYLVYSSSAKTYTSMKFKKSSLQRALWLQELLIDLELIKLYENFEVYPMHGENCYDFFRECEYLGLCTLSTANLTKPFNTVDQAKIAKESYMFEVTFEELIERQLAKN